MMCPKVSIIIPVYNAGNLVERCLQSLFSQSLDSLEYIIIDDGSSDDSMLYVRKAIAAHPGRESQVRLIVHPENRGLAATRSEGYSLATGEYVISCDSDDWADQCYYSRLYETARQEEANIVAGNLIVDQGDSHRAYPFPLFSDWQSFLRNDRWLMFSLCRHLFRRQFLEDNNLRFDPDINYAEDDYFIFRCYRYSRKNAVCMDVSYHYCKDNDNSMTCNKNTIRHLLDKSRCLEQLSGFVEANGGKATSNVILNQEKRAVKEGFYLSDTPDYHLWRKKFPEITPIVIRDSKLALSYRVAWALGQYIHPIFFKTYLNLRK